MSIQMYVKVWKSKKHWLVQCSDLGIMTQGLSEEDALGMFLDYIETAIDEELSMVYSLVRVKGKFSYYDVTIPITSKLLAFIDQRLGDLKDE